MIQKFPEILITDRDYERISTLIEWSEQDGIDLLWDELLRARIVSQRELPSDVVTMNSTVIIEDVETFQQRELKLVYPTQKKPTANEISILAPVGMALLGLRVGQEIAWPVPGAKQKRFKVLSVKFQPESQGLFFL